jgi:glucose/arabinose dehydrogenase
MLYTGDKFPGWRGSVFSGGMAGEVLSRLTLDGQRVVSEELLVQRRGRIRDVRQGTDGFIYLAIDDRGGAPSGIVRLEPAPR